MSFDSKISINRTKQLLYVFKEVRKLETDPDVSRTTQFKYSENDLAHYHVTITPVEGLYQGIPIEFELTVPPNYPAAGHPIIPKCLTNIYHPNLFSGGEICLHLDGYGNFESGFKESLETLIYGLNYLFLHPGNKSPEQMSETKRQTFEKNIEQYKIRKKLKDENQQVTIREFYSEDLNPSLGKITDLNLYFPSICMSRDSLERYVIFTLGGEKEMSLAKIETVMSQLMRDPRYEYVVVRAPQIMGLQRNENNVMMPDDSRQVKMARVSRMIAPTMISLVHHRIQTNKNTYRIGELYDTRVEIDETLRNAFGIFSNCVIILTNVVIESNYEMVFGFNRSVESQYFTMDSKQNFYDKKQTKITMFNPVRIGKQIKVDLLPIIIGKKINRSKSFQIYFGKSYEETPHIFPWIKMEFSFLVYGSGAIRNFQRTCFNLDPFNPDAPLMKPVFNKNSMGIEAGLMYTHPEYTYGYTVSFKELTPEELSFLNENDPSISQVLNVRDSRMNEQDKTGESDIPTFQDKKIGMVTEISEAEIDYLFKSIGAFDQDDQIKEMQGMQGILADMTDRSADASVSVIKISTKNHSAPTKIVRSSNKTSKTSTTVKNRIAQYLASNPDETGLDIIRFRTDHDAARRY